MFYTLKYCRHRSLTCRKMLLKIIFTFNIIKLKEKIVIFPNKKKN